MNLGWLSMLIIMTHRLLGKEFIVIYGDGVYIARVRGYMWRVGP